MRRQIINAVAAALLAIVPFVLSACDNVKDQLEEVLEKYMAAKTHGDGEALLQVIDPKNIEHADDLVSAARSASGFQVGGMPAIDRYVVGYLRVKYKSAELKTLTGRELLKTECQDKVWYVIGHEDPEFTMRKVKHNPPRASAELFADGITTDLRLEFVEVEPQWLVNDECFNELLNRAIKQMARIAHTTEDVVILRLLSAEAGRPINGAIWEPPK